LNAASPVPTGSECTTTLSSILDRPPDRDLRGSSRVLLDILDVQKVLSEFFLTDEVGRFVTMVGKLAHRPNVSFLRLLREPSKLKTLDHSLSQFGHSYTSGLQIVLVRGSVNGSDLRIENNRAIQDAGSVLRAALSSTLDAAVRAQISLYHPAPPRRAC
jgi:hypothetical protein